MTRVSSFGLLLFLIASLSHTTCAQQKARRSSPRTITGYVKTTDIINTPVPKTEVGIYGGESGITRDNGEFLLDVPSSMKKGFLITFWVKGWIITDPISYGVPGKIPLPPKELEPIPIVVIKPGDQRLLSEMGSRLVVLSATSQFKELGNLEVRAVQSQHDREFQTMAYISKLLPDSNNRVKSFFRQWIKQKAKEFAVEPSKLQQSILAWTHQAKSTFDIALASLYLGKIDKPIQLLGANVGDNIPVQQSEIFQIMAFGYALQANFKLSEKYLLKAIEASGDLEPDLYKNLGYVYILDGKKDDAERAFAAAETLVQENPVLDDIPLVIGLWQVSVSDNGPCFKIKAQARAEQENKYLLQCEYQNSCGQTQPGHCTGEIDFNRNVSFTFLSEDARIEVYGKLSPNGDTIIGDLAQRTESQRDVTVVRQIAVENAEYHRDEIAIMCGTVIGSPSKESTLLQLREVGSDRSFMIANEDMCRPLGLDQLQSSLVCGRGMIEQFMGFPTVIVDGMKDIAVRRIP